MTTVLTRGQLAKRAFVDALNPVFTRAGDAITPSGILRASLKSGPRSRRLRAALLALPGLDVERPMPNAIVALSAWLKDHGSIDGSVYRLRRREGVGSRRAGYWLEPLEPSPIADRIAHLDAEPVDESTHAGGNVTTTESTDAPKPAPEPVARVPVEPVVVEMQPTIPAAAAEMQPEAPLVYPDGRIRGGRHRDCVARAQADAPQPIRTPSTRPITLQRPPSVFEEPDDSAPYNEGPVDWLSTTKWRWRP